MPQGTEVIDLRELYNPTERQSVAHTADECFVLYGG